MYINYVNTKIGTDSVPRFSRGNTLPLVQLPFGMVSFCPQTERIKGQENWFFSPSKPYLEGIRLTHQPSPWIGDFGTVLFTPQNGSLASTPEGAWSSYKIEDSVIMPHYLKIKFIRSLCTVELTPTERGAFARFEFERESDNVISILRVGGSNEYFYENGIIFGTNDLISQGEAKSFKMYFALCLDDVVDFVKNDTENGALHIGIKGKRANVRLGISYISHEMALSNLKGEVYGELDEVLSRAKDAWEEKLSRIQIEADDERMSVFYSCMYRAFLYPHIAYEIENGTPVHYSPYTGEKCEGVRFTDTGFWDTYRTQFPLFSLIAKDEYALFLEGFLNDYKECGFLPRWLSISEVGCMPSTLIDAVIADAVVKEIGSKALHNELLEAMIKHANTKAPSRRFGREGIEEYLKYGYVPYDKCGESVNLTVDFSYGDFCIATVAKALGKMDIYEEYMKRAKSYTALFDKQTCFLRAKASSGEFRPNFSPYEWGFGYTESCAWQGTLAPVHDIEGLCELFGGKDKLLSRLDEIFDAKPIFEVGSYGAEIHEMSEMAQVDFGQCAISNQPSFAIPYMYAYLGEKEKSEHWVRRICDELFTRDSFPGDEDNGSMASWYILSCIGKYSICPSKNEWIELEPIVKYKM